MREVLEANITRDMLKLGSSYMEKTKIFYFLLPEF